MNTSDKIEMEKDSKEFDRFRDFTKQLVTVTKKDIAGRDLKEKEASKTEPRKKRS